jgi:hypothetical protein
MAGPSPYNPWSDLRARRHLELVWAELDGARGLIVGAGARRTIYLDFRQARRDRAAVLAHELVHDERGVLYDASAPTALVAKEEAFVERAVARRLVPPGALLEFVRRRSDLGEGVVATDVAAEFDVADDVAQLALELLATTGAA